MARNFKQSVPLLLLQILVATSNAQKFVPSPSTGAEDSSSVVGALGSHIELPCVIDGSSDSYIWQKKLNEDTWLNMAELCAENNNKKCRVVTDLVQQNSTVMTLVFEKLRKSDLGTFSCGVPLDRSTDAGLRAGEIDPNVYLVLKEPVAVEHDYDFGTTSHIVIVGDDVMLSCELTRNVGADEAVNATRYQVRWNILGQWRDPWELGTSHYGYFESPEFSNLTIKAVTMEDRGDYDCALWDAHKFPIFTADKIEAHLVDEDGEYIPIFVRVKENNLWELPTITIGGEVLLIIILMILIETTKWIPDGDNSSDGSTDDEVKGYANFDMNLDADDIKVNDFKKPGQ